MPRHTLYIYYHCAVAVGPKDTLTCDVFEVTFADYAKYLPYIYSDYRKSVDKS